MQYFSAQLLAITISLILFWLFFLIFFRSKDKKRKKVNWVPMCPKCGSVDVSPTFLNITRRLNLKSFAPSRFLCNKCKYEGLFPEVQVDMLEKIREELISSKTEGKAQEQKKPRN